MELNMDMSGLIALLTQMTGLTEEEVLADSNLTADDLKMDVTMEMRMDLEGGMLELPDYIREEAGIPSDAKLSAVVNEDEHTVTLSMAGYSYDLRDVPENLLEVLAGLDVCMGELEEHLMVGDIIYSDAVLVRKEHEDE